MMAILKNGEGAIPVSRLLRQDAVGQATFYRGKASNGGAGVAELEAKNAKRIRDNGIRPHDDLGSLLPVRYRELLIA